MATMAHVVATGVTVTHIVATAVHIVAYAVAAAVHGAAAPLGRGRRRMPWTPPSLSEAMATVQPSPLPTRRRPISHLLRGSNGRRGARCSVDNDAGHGLNLGLGSSHDVSHGVDHNLCQFSVTTSATTSASRRP